LLLPWKIPFLQISFIHFYNRTDGVLLEAPSIQTYHSPSSSTLSSGRDSSGKPTGMRRHGADRGFAANSPAFSPSQKPKSKHQILSEKGTPNQKKKNVIQT